MDRDRKKVTVEIEQVSLDVVKDLIIARSRSVEGNKSLDHGEKQRLVGGYKRALNQLRPVRDAGVPFGVHLTAAYVGMHDSKKPSSWRLVVLNTDGEEFMIDVCSPRKKDIELLRKKGEELAAVLGCGFQEDDA